MGATLELDFETCLACENKNADNQFEYRENDIDVKKGGNDTQNQGSWIHPDLVHLAQWN
jgi:hypothetical protein